MNTAQRYPRLSQRARTRTEVLQADERARRAEGSDDESVIAELAPRVSVLFGVAVVVLIVTLVALALK